MSKGLVQRGGPDPGLTPSGGGTGDAPVSQANLPAVVTPEPGSIKSERPGPPKVQTENWMAKSHPDAIDVNDRAWSLKKSKLREQALAVADTLKPNTNAPLFGAKSDSAIPPAEGEAAAGEGGEAAAEGESEEAKKTAELQEIAKRDRENRRLRKELKRIEASSGSAKQKEAKLRELAKVNPRGVAAYLGITDQEILKAIRDNGDKPPEVPKFEEETQPQTNEELRAANLKASKLEMELAVTKTRDAVRDMVHEDGASRWPAVTALGGEAINEAVSQAMEMIKSAKRAPTRKESVAILEHWLDVTNTKYAGIAKKIAGAGGTPKGRGAPQPRNPQPGPRENPMEKRQGKDPNDPRNRPTWREIGEAHRRKLFGG